MLPSSADRSRAVLVMNPLIVPALTGTLRKPESQSVLPPLQNLSGYCALLNATDTSGRTSIVLTDVNSAVTRRKRPSDREGII